MKNFFKLTYPSGVIYLRQARTVNDGPTCPIGSRPDDSNSAHNQSRDLGSTK